MADSSKTLVRGAGGVAIKIMARREVAKCLGVCMLLCFVYSYSIKCAISSTCTIDVTCSMHICICLSISICSHNCINLLLLQCY